MGITRETAKCGETLAVLPNLKSRETCYRYNKTAKVLDVSLSARSWLRRRLILLYETPLISPNRRTLICRDVLHIHVLQSLHRLLDARFCTGRRRTSRWFRRICMLNERDRIGRGLESRGRDWCCERRCGRRQSGCCCARGG